MRAVSVLKPGIVILLLAGLVACESSPSRRNSRPSPLEPPEAGSSTPSEAANPAPLANRKLTRAGTGAGFTPAQRAKMKRAMAAYLHHLETWPELRDEWVAMGPRAVDVLVDNMIRALWAALLTNTPSEVGRARKELILLDPAPVPVISQILEDPALPDPKTGHMVYLSTDMITQLVDLLRLAKAETEIEKLSGSDVASVRRCAYDALGHLGEPRGIAILARALGSSSSWMDRLRAARALSYSGTKEGADALVAALYDREDMVSMEAARSLALREERSALPALDARRKEARAAGNLRLSAVMGAAAKAIRGVK